MRGAPVHVSALMWSPGVVDDEVRVQVVLHLVDTVIEFLAAHDPEVFVKERPVEAFDEAV